MALAATDPAVSSTRPLRPPIYDGGQRTQRSSTSHARSQSTTNGFNLSVSQLRHQLRRGVWDTISAAEAGNAGLRIKPRGRWGIHDPASPWEPRPRPRTGAQCGYAPLCHGPRTRPPRNLSSCHNASSSRCPDPRQRIERPAGVEHRLRPARADAVLYGGRMTGLFTIVRGWLLTGMNGLKKLNVRRAPFDDLAVRRLAICGRPRSRSPSLRRRAAVPEAPSSRPR